MYILGINAAYHDPAACLVKDGKVVAAAEEERFTHVKHGKRPVPFTAYQLPYHAIAYCLDQGGIDLAALDHVAYSYDPYILLGPNAGRRQIALPLQPSAEAIPEDGTSPWDPLFLSYIVNAPRQLADGAPFHIQAKFANSQKNGKFRHRWHFVEHHAAHAASAYLPSPFEEAAVLTLDGRGEQATTSYHHGSGLHIEKLAQVNMPHSLGILYERVTEHLGFLHSSDEYKVMALASFGKPAFLKEFLDLIRLREDGQFTLGPLHLEERFGPKRKRKNPFTQRHYDIAYSLQKALEETVLELATWLHLQTGSQNLCLSGGVALNCVLNARLRDQGPFTNIWVQPAAGDAGTALGAALWVDIREGTPKGRNYRMDHVFLGPGYDEQEIETCLRWAKIPYRRLQNIEEETSNLLVDDKIIGWYQGRLEFGPRALGARSILASPIHAEMQERLNDIKDREDFRPVAPVVLEEEAGQWFEKATASPFMLFVFPVAPDKADRIPAVRHVDGTARIQTINRRQNPLYYDLVQAFFRKTGVPVLVNTSFNTRGKPIVCTPRDALECFWTSPLDALVIGPFLVEKSTPGGGQKS
ncbi:MAG: carbamoyltransferase C-terminal domain-containing protein [Syntrophotaleaceae bacterium]